MAGLTELVTLSFGSIAAGRGTATEVEQQQQLLASDDQAGDEFGTSVAIAGDTIVVGALFADNENGTEAGAAYVFD